MKKTAEVAAHFPDWQPRRFNSALSYLDGSRVIETVKSIGSAPWAASSIRVTDYTRRFVRDHG